MRKKIYLIITKSELGYGNHIIETKMNLKKLKNYYKMVKELNVKTNSNNIIVDIRRLKR